MSFASKFPLSSGETPLSLDGHFAALNDRDPAKLEPIILSLKRDHEAGSISSPGKVLGHRIRQANARSAAAATDKDQRFKPTETLGVVGFGSKVTGADGNDILDAVRGSDPDTVRRLIREVCGGWTGPNGKTKSAHHVVNEVARQLSSNGATGPIAAAPSETISVANSVDGAKDNAARLAALRQRMAKLAQRTAHLRGAGE
jgi:hypothetical protein